MSGYLNVARLSDGEPALVVDDLLLYIAECEELVERITDQEGHGALVPADVLRVLGNLIASATDRAHDHWTTRAIARRTHLEDA